MCSNEMLQHCPCSRIESAELRNRASFAVVAWRSLASNPRPYGDFLHHNQAALTTQLLRPSKELMAVKIVVICMKFPTI